MLGNGYRASPSQLDCASESVCESCTYCQPTIEFRPTLQRQHDDAKAKQQTGPNNCSSNCSTALNRPKHRDQLTKIICIMPMSARGVFVIGGLSVLTVAGLACVV